jgi:CBS domain containing-hemolysin-like protein
METGLSTGSLLLRGLVIVVLIAANAFFVASEFALVASRRTRIDAMVRRGDRKAKKVQAALQDLYRQLSAAQLGITLASILLGYVAEDTVAVLLRDWLAALPTALAFLSRAAVASVTAVAAVSFLHVVIGEQTPKAWAITYPEVTSRWIAGPLIMFSLITRPVTDLLNWSANRLVRLLGIRSAGAELERIHSPEEIMMLLRQSQKSGRIARGDVQLIEGVFEFTEKAARDVMTPRTEVIALEEDLTLGEAARRVAQAGRSRYPVFRESLDDITGVVHAKQILAGLRDRPEEQIRAIMREPLFVPGTREVEDVLADMKRLKSHLAVVLDEYGGTAGIVTMEDLLEEIVGQIYDEYDRAEPAPTSAGGTIMLPGAMDIEQANERYKLGLSDAEYQTVGGFVFGSLGRLPHPGDRINLKDVALEVVEMEGRRVKRLKLLPHGSPPKAMGGDAPLPSHARPKGDGGR